MRVILSHRPRWKNKVLMETLNNVSEIHIDFESQRITLNGQSVPTRDTNMKGITIMEAKNG